MRRAPERHLVTRPRWRHVFDSFECAIHALAPRCEHCGCAVIGHGHESDGRFFCCAHCASQQGIDRLADRAGLAPPTAISIALS